MKRESKSIDKKRKVKITHKETVREIREESQNRLTLTSIKLILCVCMHVSEYESVYYVKNNI